MALDPALARLENESIHILREIVAEAARPVLLYSVGKDSSVLLHLALKAFRPAPLPFPLLHVDTGWKFRAMIAFRDATVRRHGLTLIAHHNAAGAAAGIDPFDEPGRHTEVMKTEALKAALDAGGFDVAIGGARRDEERSRAKERIISIRGPGHRWDPRAQRPELWNLFNLRLAPGHTARAFPLSNWTERDVWRYVAAEAIEVVDLYFAAPRPVLRRGETLIVVDDDRLRLAPGEVIAEEMVRFRTLGCWPLTGAIVSQARSVEAVIEEMRSVRSSERAARVIDRASSMEEKKRDGYF